MAGGIDNSESPLAKLEAVLCGVDGDSVFPLFFVFVHNVGELETSLAILIA